MKRLMSLALLAAFASVAVADEQAASIVNLKCPTESVPAGWKAPILHGKWDTLMDVSGELSFGLLSIGRVDGGYGGSLTMSRTAPVVVREITLTGNAVHLSTASPQGDVVFDGKLSANGNRMCGVVSYHDGSTFPMVAQRIPTTYPVQDNQSLETPRQAPQSR